MPKAGGTLFAVRLEKVPMPPEVHATRPTTTRFRRPALARAVVNPKAACLCPKGARMPAGARAKGCGNALVADVLGTLAETAAANLFPVRDGAVFTPVANGTFPAGITQARHIPGLRAAGVEGQETVMTFDGLRAADEVFLSGNLARLTPVVEFDGTACPVGPVRRRARALSRDRAQSGGD